VGQPEDIVPTVVFLASDAARDITGVVVPREIFVAKEKANDPANR
jgi:NAD(P)-dependent dehydrogenase (short-subunit alcohol dehydrogenase family)